MYDLVCVGESMALLAPDPPVALRDGSMLRLEVAGAESNVAITLARLGARTAWVSRLGADPLGEIVRGRIASAGVDTGFVEMVAGHPTGVYFKNPGPAGTTVLYYRRGSAASTMDESIWARVPAGRVVHLSGITPALSGSCERLVADALRRRRYPGAVMSFDVNYRPALWPVDRAGPALAALADRADLVFVGRDEAGVLWGTGTPEDVRARLPHPATVVVKDGPVGATAITAAGATFVPAPPVEVVEPVGAGDAFAAGYLFGLVNDMPEAERLRLGHRLAAAALTTVGDIADIPAQMGRS